MKSAAVEDNSYYSFTDNETGIEIIWEFNQKSFCWEVLVFKDNQKEYAVVPASNKPTAESVNDYDIQRLSQITLKLLDFVSKQLEIEAAKVRLQNSDK